MFQMLEKIFVLFTISVCTVVASICLYWLFIQPSNILSDLSPRAFVEDTVNNRVLAGSTVQINRAFCINNNQHIGEVFRTFTNHVVYQLPDTTTLTLGSKLRCNEKRYLIDIPANLPTGEYEYRVRIMYRINPLKTVSYDLAAVPMNVVNPVWDAARKLLLEKN